MSFCTKRPTMRSRCTRYYRGMFYLLLLVIVSSCGFPGLSSTTSQLPQVDRERVQETPVLPPIQFPGDEGSHDYLTEWWYYTGHLEARDTQGKMRHYGFEFVIFQVSRGTLPLIFPAHFAITDLSRNEFHYDQRRVMKPREHVPPASETQGINLNVGDWTIQGKNGQDHIVAGMADYGIDLNITTQKAVSLHNENGIIPYGLGGFSYYYSHTRMAVTGMLQDHGEMLQVTGQAWMDHQWGNFLALDGGGWDWYSLQLDDNTEIMLYFIRDMEGKVIDTYVGYIDASGKEYVLPSDALKMDVLQEWTSPQTGITYPSGWDVTIDDPVLKIALTVTPLLQDQELVTTETTGNIYWEGAVSITGKLDNQAIGGKGYVELTGYLKS